MIAAADIGQSDFCMRNSGLRCTGAFVVDIYVSKGYVRVVL